MPLSVPVRGDADKKLGAGFAPLSVSSQDNPNMTVRVRAGTFWNAANQIVEYPGGNSPALVASPSSARWALLSMTGAGALTLTYGSPAVAPSPPAKPVDHLPLALIYTTTSTTSIRNDNIFDVRPFLSSEDSVANLAVALADRPTSAAVTAGISAAILPVQADVDTKADQAGTPSTTFTLNLGGVAASTSTFVVERALSNDVMIRWNEPLTKWEFTNDGVTFMDLGALPGSGVTSVNGDVGPVVVLTNVDVGAAAAVHTHVAADVTNFSTAADARVAAAVGVTVAPLSHTHVAADVTNFSTAVTTLTTPLYATAAQGTNADVAFTWGDHATAGYLTSFTETDPVATAALGVHVADATLHLTAGQNTFLDAVTVTASEVNQLAGVTTAVLETVDVGVSVAAFSHTHPISDVTGLTAALAAKLEWVAAPATATDPGTAGQVAYDAGFLYVCVATNTWVRTVLATF